MQTLTPELHEEVMQILSIIALAPKKGWELGKRRDWDGRTHFRIRKGDMCPISGGVEEVLGGDFGVAAWSAMGFLREGCEPYPGEAIQLVADAADDLPNHNPDIREALLDILGLEEV